MMDLLDYLALLENWVLEDSLAQEVSMDCLVPREYQDQREDPDLKETKVQQDLLDLLGWLEIKDQLVNRVQWVH